MERRVNIHKKWGKNWEGAGVHGFKNKTKNFLNLPLQVPPQTLGIVMYAANILHIVIQ